MMARILCQAVGAGPTGFTGCMRVAACCWSEVFFRPIPPSTVGLLTAEDEPDGSGEKRSCLEL